MADQQFQDYIIKAGEEIAKQGGGLLTGFTTSFLAILVS